MKDRKRMEGRRKAALTAAGILVTCVFLFPLYWMVATSLRPPGESFSNPSFFPSRIVFDSYILKNEHGISLFTYLKKQCCGFVRGNSPHPGFRGSGLLWAGKV